MATRAASNWGLGTLNPLDARRSRSRKGERCLGPLGFKGLLITSSWHGRFIDGEDAFAFWEWAQDRQVPLFIHPPRVPIGHDQQMDQYKLDELVGRPFDTAMTLARMILSGLLDRFSQLKIVVAHMGGGLLPVMGRLDFGWRLGCDGMPERAVIRCKERPSDYLRMLSVDTMGFWAPHVREAIEVLGVDRVMFGTDYGPVPIDPKEHVDIVKGLAISTADKKSKKFSGATPRSFSIWRLPGDNPWFVGAQRSGARNDPEDIGQSTTTFAVLITTAHFSTSPGSIAGRFRPAS